MDPSSTRLLLELRAGLLEATASSREMRRILHRLRGAGWSAYVMVEVAEAGESESGSEEGPAGAEPRPLLLEAAPQAPGELQLEGSDESFLRSLGIDPATGAHRV